MFCANNYLKVLFLHITKGLIVPFDEMCKKKKNNN